MSFTTASNVMMFLNKESFTPAEGSVVNMLIPLIDGVINNYCGLNLLATDYTNKRYNGTGGSTLDVGVYPINSVTSVKIREDVSTFTDVTSSVYFNEVDGLLKLDQYAEITSFTRGVDNIYCTFNAGYDELSIPSELVYAASYLVAINFKKIVYEWIGADEAKFEQLDIKIDSIELPVLVKRVLDRYRVVAVF